MNCQVLSVPALDASLNSTGDKLIYHDIKGYESDWRKHHESAVTRDIWVYDMKENTYTKLSDFSGEDRDPVFHSDNDTFFYLSEENGSFNVFKSSLGNPSETSAITRFKDHPVRFLTKADDNTLCFSYHGEYVGYEPGDKWIKPSIVLMGESNYSDAHLFPVAYKAKGEGKTLGMPVPGTGTFVWWEQQIDPTLVYGIPMGGWRMMDGRFCENTQMEPDIMVRLEPSVMTSGRDQQIEAAVKELMK